MGVLTQKEFDRRIEALLQRQNPCVLCPNRCGIDRESRSGRCASSSVMEVASAVLHFGEEPCVSGKNGSGNIFFARCNMRCVYCQNHEISQPTATAKFRQVTPTELARIMLDLQDKGAANINLVSGSHFLPQITAAIKIASADGLKIPILYNTNSYDEVETLELLEGIIDIYLADLRYSSEQDAFEFSGTRNYPLYSRLAVKEMFRQVSDTLILDEQSNLVKGMIIRLLVLPNDIAGIEETLDFIARELSNRVAVSLMSQYFPAHRAMNIPLLSRKINYGEYSRALDLLDKYGFEKGWTQDDMSADFYHPDFSNESEPFRDAAYFKGGR